MPDVKEPRKLRFMLSVSFEYDQDALQDLDADAVLKKLRNQGLFLPPLSARGIDIQSVHIGALQ